MASLLSTKTWSLAFKTLPATDKTNQEKKSLLEAS